MEDTTKTKNKGDYFLYCRHCLQPISKEAETCPGCGNSDPFYFKAIKSTQKELKVSWWFYILVAFLVEIVFQLFGWSHGIITWGFPQVAVFVLLCVLAHICIGIMRKSQREKFEREMTDVFNKANDIKALTRWQAIVNSIID